MRRVATVLALALLLLGAILLIQAKNTPLFIDAAQFQLHASKLGPGQEKEYWALLTASRTEKPRLENRGGTALVLGLALLLASRLGHWIFRTPSRRGFLLLLMFVPPLLTYASSVFEYEQLQMRGDYPPWSDAGPYMRTSGFVVFGVLPVIWMSLHVLLVPDVYYRRQPLSIAFSRKINPWLGFLVLVMTLVTAMSVAVSNWWALVPGLAWLYVYLCMAATRCAPHLFADQETEWPPAWNKP